MMFVIKLTVSSSADCEFFFYGLHYKGCLGFSYEEVNLELCQEECVTLQSEEYAREANNLQSDLLRDSIKPLLRVLQSCCEVDCICSRTSSWRGILYPKSGRTKQARETIHFANSSWHFGSGCCELHPVLHFQKYLL